MSQFKKIIVKDIKRETQDTVSIGFDIPLDLKPDFAYKAGQYITLKTDVFGEDVRRAYSLCSFPDEDDFRIGVKKVENGKMSSFLNETLKVGDEVEVMPPLGDFCLGDDAGNIVGFAAGSGITPIISIIKTVLRAGGQFTLFYGNKTKAETIFKTDLDRLKEKYGEKLNLHYIYSRENLVDEFGSGRINEAKVNAAVRKELDLLKADEFFMCGPEQMILDVTSALKYLGVNDSKLHFELFTAPTKPDNDSQIVESDFSGESQVTVIMDGEEFEFPLNHDGEFILDASIDNGADAPFSCKGAVCCTCKAQVIEGKAVMEMNYSLSDQEVEDGFILTCQAHPASEKLVVDYDVI